MNNPIHDKGDDDNEEEEKNSTNGNDDDTAVHDNTQTVQHTLTDPLRPLIDKSN